MIPVTIKRFALDHVLENDKILYNTNNHFRMDKQPMPADYHQRIDMGNTRNWIEFFHPSRPPNIVLDRQDLAWMRKAHDIAEITGKFSELYTDELAETCARYTAQVPPGQWFIRTDPVSLKYGVHGTGPYTSIEQIIQSIATSGSGHDCFHTTDTTCTVYFLPWLDLDPNKEFRIFVYKNQITAISSQHLYTINAWLNTLSDADIECLVQRIVAYFNIHIMRHMAYMGDYVMDLVLIGPDDTPYFIEPNSFGRNYASGSALFQWDTDHDILYNASSIEFRYTNRY